MKIGFVLNGREVESKIRPNTRLVDLIRSGFGLTGTKVGCEKGDCGACTVLLDDEPVNSCLVLAAKVHGRRVMTIEGLGTPEKPHPIQRAFVREGAVQCGFCTPGMVLAAKALLDKVPSPTRRQIARALEGNLCRCTGYARIFRAVEAAARELRGESISSETG